MGTDHENLIRITDQENGIDDSNHLGSWSKIWNWFDYGSRITREICTTSRITTRGSVTDLEKWSVERDPRITDPQNFYLPAWKLCRLYIGSNLLFIGHRRGRSNYCKKFFWHRNVWLKDWNAFSKYQIFRFLIRGSISLIRIKSC